MAAVWPHQFPERADWYSHHFSLSSAEKFLQTDGEIEMHQRLVRLADGDGLLRAFGSIDQHGASHLEGLLADLVHQG